MIYVIITPQTDTPLGYLHATQSPSLETLFDSIAWSWNFADRDALVEAHPNLFLGFAILH